MLSLATIAMMPTIRGGFNTVVSAEYANGRFTVPTNMGQFEPTVAIPSVGHC